MLGQAGFWIAIGGSATASVAVAVELADAELDWLHAIGGIALLLGYVLYGIATIRAKVLPAWSGWAFIVVPLALFLPEGGYATIVFGVVWLALGYLLWTRSRTTTSAA